MPSRHDNQPLRQRWSFPRPVEQLIREEDEARRVDILGIPFNVVIPDGGGGSNSRSLAPSRSTSTNSPSEQGAGVAQQKAEADLQDAQARAEDGGMAATFKVAALWLVLISQLWLLVVLWNDPMGGDPSSTWLQD